METIWNWKTVDRKDLSTWLNANEDIAPRVSFSSGWRWIRSGADTKHSTYIDTVNFNMHSQPLENEYLKYLIKERENFLEKHDIQTKAGYYIGEFSHQLQRHIKRREFDISFSSSTQIFKNSIIHTRSCNFPTITLLAQIIEEDFLTPTRIIKNGKANYSILINKDEAQLQLDFQAHLNITGIRQETQNRQPAEDDSESKLKKEEAELIKKLEAIRKKLST